MKRLRFNVTQFGFMLGESGDAGKADEMELIEETRKHPCCANNCLNKFPVYVIYACREQCRELQLRYNEHVSHLHLVLLGHMDACLRDNETTARSHQKNTERQRTRLLSTFHGVSVCVDAFHFIHDISRRVTRDLKVHFERHGLEPKVHGNVFKTSAAKALPLEVRQNAVKFIENYAINHALVLPGRTPGVKNPDVLVLPCGTTKRRVYDLYGAACGDSMPMSYTLFCMTWKTFLSGVCIQHPRSDLCATCKHDTMTLLKLRALDDDARADVLSRSMKHLDLVAEQRQHYKSAIAVASQSIPAGLKFGGESADASVVQHYSFDFAQQVFVPNSSQQVGPIYFLVPYKLALFGVICEPLAKMVMYVIPESVLVSKGSNMVISLFHHFLTKYGSNITKMVLNADNCVGQNKNNTVLQYLMWRVMNGLSSHIELAFLLAGHTKFAPDYGFGVFKRLYRHNDVNCIDDVCGLMSQSKLLIAEPTGTEQGEVLIPCYDWQSKFSALGKIVGIKQYHHFVFDSCKPSMCSVRQYAGSPATDLPVAGDSAALSADLPTIITPPGLSQARQEYLFKRIRQYVAAEHQDRLCPAPAEVATSSEVCVYDATAPLPPVAGPSHESEPVQEAVSRKRLVSIRGHAASASDASEVGIAMAVTKRTTPKCGYCEKAGHRNSVKNGRFLCPERRSESAGD
jgi:hypothetical protein